MKLESSLLGRWEKCKSDFDMAAFCYDYIIRNIGSLSESVFISSYMDAGKKTSLSNPNLKTLWKLENDIKDILYNNLDPDVQVKLVFDGLEKAVECLLPFGEERINLSSVFMAVLIGIDLYTSARVTEKYQFSSNGPLNHPERAESLVYLKNNTSMLNAIRDRYRFRKEVDSGGIGDTLTVLILIKKSDLFSQCEYPRVTPLHIHEGRVKLRNQLYRQKKLKIAILPDNKPKCFKFDENSTPGSTFRVRYMPGQEKEIQRHCDWLRMVVESGANLVIFPEFFISPEILAGMKDWMVNNADESWMKQSALIAVCAGTTWDEQDNNIMHLIDWQGIELGTYYKYSPFRALPPDAETSDTYGMCEYLTTPGKKSILIDIDFIGRILPAICRDVIDGSFTERLVKNFRPFMLVTSAYSSSVASFNRHYSSYASRYYVTSILCNACDAAKGSALNLCSVPVKEKSDMGCFTEKINKCNSWESDCPESCYIMLELNFKTNQKSSIRKGPGIKHTRYKVRV